MSDLPTAVAELSKTFAGTLLLPGAAGYDDARRVHNGMIDKQPAVIARCRGTADVADAVRLARAQGLEIAVRGGGHNVAGRSMVDGGLVVDLAEMRGVHVYAAAKRAHVQGGATWKDVNRETQLHGLATTGGVVSSTGVGGLTLGGGFGWLMPKYGMAMDNLVSAELVMADGTVVRVSDSDHADLFWAIRGGGGNFGIATSFEFTLHAVGPMVTGGIVAWPIDKAPDVLRFFRDFSADLPDEVLVATALLTGPDGTRLVAIAAGHCGAAEQAAADLAPVKSFGSPVMDAMGPIPYNALNAMLDDAFPKGARYYWKSHFLETFSEGAIDALVESFASCPAPQTQILVEGFHGAGTRVPVEATAYSMRVQGYNCAILGEWTDAAQDDACTAWTRKTYDGLRPFMSAHRYANYMDKDDSGAETLAAVYGPNLERLKQVKRKYDPDNVFHMNLNIPPA